MPGGIQKLHHSFYRYNFIYAKYYGTPDKFHQAIVNFQQLLPISRNSPGRLGLIKIQICSTKIE
jgi:hypothetical protein